MYLLLVFEFVSKNLLYGRWVVFNVIPVVFVYVVLVLYYITRTLIYKRITHTCAVYTRVLGSSETVAPIYYSNTVKRTLQRGTRTTISYVIIVVRPFAGTFLLRSKKKFLSSENAGVD